MKASGCTFSAGVFKISFVRKERWFLRGTSRLHFPFPSAISPILPVQLPNKTFLNHYAHYTFNQTYRTETATISKGTRLGSLWRETARNPRLRQPNQQRTTKQAAKPRLTPKKKTTQKTTNKMTTRYSSLSTHRQLNLRNTNANTSSTLVQHAATKVSHGTLILKEPHVLCSTDARPLHVKWQEI